MNWGARTWRYFIASWPNRNYRWSIISTANKHSKSGCNSECCYDTIISFKFSIDSDVSKHEWYTDLRKFYHGSFLKKQCLQKDIRHHRCLSCGSRSVGCQSIHCSKRWKMVITICLRQTIPGAFDPSYDSEISIGYQLCYRIMSKFCAPNWKISKEVLRKHRRLVSLLRVMI